jgi:16S rRNA (guanine(1405)-N(7))-methyltransferase
MVDAERLDELVTAVRSGARYRGISEDLVRRVGAQELGKRSNLKEAIKSTRSKLHQVGGAYLEAGPDFDVWQEKLAALPSCPTDPVMQEFCRQAMTQHASTRERLPILEEFFGQTLASLGPIHSVLDLACGLNPLALAWMPVADDVVYHACDIYEDMLAFVGGFLDHCGVQQHVSVCDLSIECPSLPVQVVFLLKTIPCLEQLDKTVGPRLLDSIAAEHLLVSFPVRSLGGRAKGMEQNYENHFHQLVAGRGWQIKRFQFRTELAFLVSR